MQLLVISNAPAPALAYSSTLINTIITPKLHALLFDAGLALVAPCLATAIAASILLPSDAMYMAMP